MKTNHKNQNRNYLFDNMRGILIFLVVTGHMLREQLGYSYILDTMYYFIYLFHMPAFIFVTGYFSKNIDKCRDKALQSFLIPFVILNSVFWVYNRVFLEIANQSFRVFTPRWGLWFFLAVFIWKIMLKDVVRIRYILPISFMVGLLSGYSGEFTEKMALARVLSFFPFFLLGYYCSEGNIKRLRKVPKIISVIILGAFSGISYLNAKYDVFTIEHFYMRKPYCKLPGSMFSGIWIRVFLYVSAIMIIFSLINLISVNKTKLSLVGKNSITVYVVHLFIVSKLRRLELPWDGTNYYIVYAIIVSLIITYLCSRQKVLDIYNFMMNKITSLLIVTK